MEKRPKSALFRLVLAVALCSLFLGLTESPEEADGCGGGHDSGTLTIVNSTDYIAMVHLAGPIVTSEVVQPKKTLSVKIRTGFYHWTANFYAGISPLMDEVDTGVATVDKDKPGKITVIRKNT